jgi:hypothetical protein
VAAFNYNITAINVSAGLTADAGNVAVPATGVATGYLTNDKYTNVTNSPLTVTYTVVPVSAALCAGDPRDVVITINPQPIVSTALDATVCSDLATSLTLAGHIRSRNVLQHYFAYDKSGAYGKRWKCVHSRQRSGGQLPGQ